MVQKEEVVIAL